MIEFRGAAKPCDNDDLIATAFHLEASLAAFKAVLEVASGGAGFDEAGRVTTRFERHIFYHQLQDKRLRARAVRAGLAYPRWGERPYPASSDETYDEIRCAVEIDQEAALISTAWGLGQVMGYNFRLCRCSSVEQLVREAQESEANQLYQMVTVILGLGLTDELTGRDWLGFAKGYAGPGYARTAYDERLAQAYARYA